MYKDSSLCSLIAYNQVLGLVNAKDSLTISRHHPLKEVYLPSFIHSDITKYLLYKKSHWCSSLSGLLMIKSLREAQGDTIVGIFGMVTVHTVLLHSLKVSVSNNYVKIPRGVCVHVCMAVCRLTWSTLCSFGTWAHRYLTPWSPPLQTKLRRYVAYIHTVCVACVSVWERYIGCVCVCGGGWPYIP